MVPERLHTPALAFVTLSTRLPLSLSGPVVLPLVPLAASKMTVTGPEALAAGEMGPLRLKVPALTLIRVFPPPKPPVASEMLPAMLLLPATLSSAGLFTLSLLVTRL